MWTVEGIYKESGKHFAAAVDERRGVDEAIEAEPGADCWGVVGVDRGGAGRG